MKKLLIFIIIFSLILPQTSAMQAFAEDFVITAPSVIVVSADETAVQKIPFGVTFGESTDGISKTATGVSENEVWFDEEYMYFTGALNTTPANRTLSITCSNGSATAVHEITVIPHISENFGSYPAGTVMNTTSPETDAYSWLSGYGNKSVVMQDGSGRCFLSTAYSNTYGTRMQLTTAADGAMDIVTLSFKMSLCSGQSDYLTYLKPNSGVQPLVYVARNSDSTFSLYEDDTMQTLIASGITAGSEPAVDLVCNMNRKTYEVYVGGEKKHNGTLAVSWFRTVLLTYSLYELDIYSGTVVNGQSDEPSDPDDSGELTASLTTFMDSVATANNYKKGEFKAVLDITSDSSVPYNVAAMLAFYDENGVLYDVESQFNTICGSGQIRFVTDIERYSGTSAKLFVFDALNSLIPLAKPFELVADEVGGAMSAHARTYVNGIKTPGLLANGHFTAKVGIENPLRELKTLTAQLVLENGTVYAVTASKQTYGAYTELELECDISDCTGKTAMLTVSDGENTVAEFSLRFAEAERNATVYLIGDSLCQTYDKASYPRQGWGCYLQNYFKDNITVDNRAQSGWTTKQFIESEDAVYGWDAVMNDASYGDYVVVALGINDSSRTNPYKTTHAEYIANLEKFTADCRSRGVEIIFSTPTVFGGTMGAGGWVYTPESDSWANRGVDMITVGESLGVPVIRTGQLMCDTYGKMAAQYYALNPEAIFTTKGCDYVRKYFHLIVSEMLKPQSEGGWGCTADTLPVSSDDLVHVNERGADKLAQMIAGLIKESGATLGDFVK